MECLLRVSLYARYFQELYHLLFRVASELGITNPDEEIEAKGGEMEEMRKNILKLPSSGTQIRTRHEFLKSTEISLSTPSRLFLMSPKGWD